MTLSFSHPSLCLLFSQFYFFHSPNIVKIMKALSYWWNSFHFSFCFSSKILSSNGYLKNIYVKKISQITSFLFRWNEQNFLRRLLKWCRCVNMYVDLCGADFSERRTQSPMSKTWSALRNFRRYQFNLS